MTTRPVLLIPGIYNSGPTHWQSLWQPRHAGVARVEQADWDHPDCDTWVRTLDDAVAASPQPPILVAHSLGCLVAVHWAARHPRPVQALARRVRTAAGLPRPAESAGPERSGPSAWNLRVSHRWLAPGPSRGSA